MLKTLGLAAAAVLLTWSANAQAPDGIQKERPARAFVGIGLTSGGDRLLAKRSANSNSTSTSSNCNA